VPWTWVGPSSWVRSRTPTESERSRERTLPPRFHGLCLRNRRSGVAACPLMKDARSPARYSATFATSSGVAMRCTGRIYELLELWFNAVTIHAGPSIAVGRMEFTATPDLKEGAEFDHLRTQLSLAPGCTSLHLVTYPPSSVFSDPSFNVEEGITEPPAGTHASLRRGDFWHQCLPVAQSLPC
jgi:hypothetical protein